MNYKEIFEAMIANNTSDIFVREHSPLRGRVYTEIKTINNYVFKRGDIDRVINDITDDDQKESLRKNRSCEFAIRYTDRWRFRVAIFYQNGNLTVIIRKIDLHLLSFQDLSLPEKVLSDFCRERRGLILLTGISGSGKSTTIASMIEYINQHYGRHVLTIEEPIEFTFDDITTGEEISQWATSASASSEYGNPDWAASQATGEPDTIIEECADLPTAWASQGSDTVEWLELYYDTPVYPTEVNIIQTHSPDQVVMVELVDTEGTYHEVYTGEPENLWGECPYTLSILVWADYQAVGVKITIDQSVIPVTWNEIDAVELVGIPE